MSYSQNQVPDMLRSGAVDSNPFQRIDTSILDPVVISDTFIRFNLENKGLLNPASRITFSLKAVGEDAFFPMSTGIGSIVSSSVLKIGGKTICSVQDFPHYHSYKSSFIEQEVNKERETFQSARTMANEVINSIGNASATNLGSSLIGIDSGREQTINFKIATAADTTPTGNSQLLSVLLVDNLPVYSIRLDELIPCLKGVMLPTFMLKEEVQIELQLTDLNAKRLSFAGNFTGGGSPNVVNCPINPSECQLIADYTFLSGDAMDKFARDNSKLDYTFLEPRMTKTTIASAADAANQIRNIGGAGRFVNKVFVSVSSDLAGAASVPINALGNSFTLLNSYRSIAPAESGAVGSKTYTQLTSNIKKNDRFLYPIDRKSSALHYHGVNDAEGAPIECTRAMYARQGSSLTKDTFEGHHVDSNLSGQYFHTAYRMNDGERVNFRGLELHNKLPNINAAELPLYQRVYIEVQKVMVIDNGIVDSYYR